MKTRHASVVVFIVTVLLSPARADKPEYPGFSNRGPRSSDLALVNLDAENDTFHLVEITRKTGDRKGYWGE